MSLRRCCLAARLLTGLGPLRITRPSARFLARVRCLPPLINPHRQLRPFSTRCSLLSDKTPVTVYNMACPGNLLRWDFLADDIGKETDELIASSRAVYDALGELPKEQVTYDAVIQALSNDHRDYTTRRNQLDFFQHVSPHKDLRDASVTADKKLSDFDVEMSMRQDVFDNLQEAEQKLGSSLKPEAKRYLERLIKLGKRNGLHLSKDVQDKIKTIKKRMSELSIDFNKNLNEENTMLEFEEEELVGVPEDLLKTLDKSEEGTKLKVSLKYPHYFPCMKHAKNPKTRKMLETAFNSRCMEENSKILEELVTLRQQKADILGYPTHSSYVLEMRMAKNPEAVGKFLAELTEKLQILKDEEMKLFLEYKKEECDKFGYENDNKINMWDMRYYMTRAEERKYTVDHNKLKEYFPMPVVTKGLLEIYQELLNLKFEEVKDAQVWQDDVKLYSVKDGSDDELLGYFYLDLYPRVGKYGHAAAFDVQPGCLSADGSRQVAVSAMVANFAMPTEEHPSLLDHREVETFFHEFGHVMHQICAKADFALFSGTSVERDFVEAPSQMLENWCWERESLNRLSEHFETKGKIPDELLNKLLASRNANAGVFNLRQILLGTFDQTIHKTGKADTAAVFAELSSKILEIPSTPNTNMSASFGHLAGGYDAQYYGYLWSEVFSADMFLSRFKKEGIMSDKVGMDYRNYILQPGGSIDAADMLKNFLGREPTPDAFLQHKGLKVTPK